MTRIDESLLARLPLAQIARVDFYKRDEITSDLICCEVLAGGRTWTFHEELVGWDLLLDHLGMLPDLRADWFAEVSQPPFGACETVAFCRD